MEGYRVRKNDRLLVRMISSVAGVLSIRFRVVYDNGKDDDLFVDPVTADAARTVQTAEGRNRADAEGWIVGGEVSVGTVATKRGQIYLDVSTTDGSAVTPLCKGYVYDGHSLTPGEFVESGPGGGEGFLSWVTLASNATPPVDVTRVLAAANTIRVIRGFAWYVNCAVVAATRTMEVRLERTGLAVPTGFAGRGLIWSSGTVTLTTGEEGMIWSGEKYSILNDNGAATASSTASAAVPFPYLAPEDDLAELVFDIGAADAADVGSLYLLQEEWLVF